LVTAMEAIVTCVYCT